MTINSDNFLDTLGSYINCKQAVSNELTGDNAQCKNAAFQLDQGVPFLSRVVISSGGNTLEDVSDYNKLNAMMIQHQIPSEYSENVGETQGFNYNGHNNTSLVNAIPSRRIHVNGVAALPVPEVAILQPKVDQHIVTKKHLKYLDTCWDAWNEDATDFDPRVQGLGNECSFTGTSDAEKIFNPNMSVKNYEFKFNLMSALFSQEKYFLLFENQPNCFFVGSTNTLFETSNKLRRFLTLAFLTIHEIIVRCSQAPLLLLGIALRPLGVVFVAHSFSPKVNRRRICGPAPSLLRNSQDSSAFGCRSPG